MDTTSTANPVAGDYLYLKNPNDGLFNGFKFNVDFFAAAGDGRWWHDHRIPGGIGFTANGTGHMRHFREWYSQRGQDQGDWFLTQAMKTIAHAHPTRSAPDGASPEDEGRVTWLRDLKDGHPLKDSPCPFSGPVPSSLQGKDWTTYEGLLHTDHNVRREFFEGRELPSTRLRPYLMDFTYLHDKRQADYVNFMEGVRLSEEDVFEEIGRPDTWRYRSGGEPLRPERTMDQESEIRELLRVCEEWQAEAEADTK